MWLQLVRNMVGAYVFVIVPVHRSFVVWPLGNFCSWTWDPDIMDEPWDDEILWSF